ncbi:MAG: hypothetical protein ABR523_01690 [Desulfurivibrionaceae bacterium]
MIGNKQITALIVCGLALFAGGCSLLTTTPTESRQSLYVPERNDTILNRYAPVFLVEENRKNYNRIGTPAARLDDSGEEVIYVDTGEASVYAMTQEFATDRDGYTNLIYRIHFPQTPLPHLTAGWNVGLLVYVTLNSEEEPVLITTLHTCGCYLAFIPTGNLPEGAKPDDWPEQEQTVYGQSLPVVVEKDSPGERLIIKISGATHRVTDLDYADPSRFDRINRIPLHLNPMDALNRLPIPDDGATSFFETEGFRKGLVKGSRKPLEMTLMGWWAFDPHVGVDKALGPPDETGATMYTSLKFWNRDKSNIWYFRRFLDYWGWDL